METEKGPNNQLAGEEQYKKEIAGLNRRNSQLEKELKEFRAKYEETHNSEARRAAELDRRERILTLATEKGIDPQLAMTLITGDDEDRLDAFQGAVDQEAETRLEEEISRRFPHREKPQGGLQRNELTYNDLLSMSDEQLKGLPSYMINRLTEAATRMETQRERISKLVGGIR